MYSLYGTRRWRNRRTHQLRIEPLCRMCLADGKVVAATIADHIEPWHGDVNKFWLGALQSLCSHCHESRKKFLEVHGYNKACAPDGWPLDPGHPVYSQT